MLKFKEVISRFSYLLHPYTIDKASAMFNPSAYDDIDDVNAMISDVSAFLQYELVKRGCTLIVYSFDDYPTGDYLLLGDVQNKLIGDNTVYVPDCINPRKPIYTEISNI